MVIEQPAPSTPSGVSDERSQSDTLYCTRLSPRPGYPAIDFVNFTIGVGSSWKLACTVRPPPSSDVFECDANLVQLHVPPGSIRVSFDVYDRMGNSIAAPNGVHTLTYTP
jgi:hypothetical protein